MIFLEALLITWGVFVVLSACMDAGAMYCGLSGRWGEEACNLAWERVEQDGGMAMWVFKGAAYDIFMPWVAWEGYLAARRQRRRSE